MPRTDMLLAVKTMGVLLNVVFSCIERGDDGTDKEIHTSDTVHEPSAIDTVIFLTHLVWNRFSVLR